MIWGVQSLLYWRNKMKKKRSDIFKGDDFSGRLYRSFFYSCGLTRQEMDRPLIAIVNTWNEMHPGHRHLRQISERVKDGVRQAGGLPLEFNTIALCDGFCNGHLGSRYTLPSRQVIADSIEIAVVAHRYDAMVLIGGCDKIVPALLMAAGRIDLASIVVTSGPMFPGHWARTGLKASLHRKDYIEALAGEAVDPEIVEEGYASLWPCAGSCWAMGTANTMSCLTEALGMSLPSDGTTPGVASKKLRLAAEAGVRIMGLLADNLTPSRIMDQAALDNALTVNMAIGGSANTVLHLPAVAHELGIQLDYERFEKISRRTPYLSHIEPSGPHHVVDLDRAGGVPGVMKALGEKINQNCLTATGKTVAENLAQAEIFDHRIIRSLDDPIHPYGSIAILKGSLAPEGGVIKQVGLSEALWKFTGPANVFNSEEEAFNGLEAGSIKAGQVVVIRYEGPRGGPGMREMAMFREALAMGGLADSTYVVTDGRFSGFTSGASIGYLSPEAANGGPLALVENGDLIHIDVAKRILDLNVDEEILKRRRNDWVPLKKEVPRGYLRHYAKTVSPASEGGIIDYERD